MTTYKGHKVHDGSNYNGEKYVVWHPINDRDEWWWAVTYVDNSMLQVCNKWIDLSNSTILCNVRHSCRIVDQLAHEYFTFSARSGDTIMPFKSEEELHMAILKYPELFTDMRLLSKEEVFGI